MIALGAGMPSLRVNPLPEGQEEIRLWLWNGLLLPHQMVRLTHARGRWLGELWRYWPREDGAFSGVMAHCGCARTVEEGDYMLCRVLEEKGIDWEAFAQRLQANGLREGRGDVEIEVRTGASYRRIANAEGRIAEMIRALDAKPCD